MPTVYSPVLVEAGKPLNPGEVTMDSPMLGHFQERLIADRDRHSSNATSFEKLLEMDYARSQQFREANAARIVMEAGSGRTRAETNLPGATSAAGNAG